jgi:hypothetical protein
MATEVIIVPLLAPEYPQTIIFNEQSNICVVVYTSFGRYYGRYLKNIPLHPKDKH